MRVKMILPALTEATSPFFRPIKYSLFPPLGLATLAGFLDEDDEVSIWDEHVERVPLDDEPDLVVIQVYITSARRSYAIADRYRARGVYVALAGLYREFYRWGSIWKSAATKSAPRDRLRHIAYAGGWKKFEPLWDVLIRGGQVLHALPFLELILEGFGRHPTSNAQPAGLALTSPLASLTDG